MRFSWRLLNSAAIALWKQSFHVAKLQMTAAVVSPKIKDTDGNIPCTDFSDSLAPVILMLPAFTSSSGLFKSSYVPHSVSDQFILSAWQTRMKCCAACGDLTFIRWEENHSRYLELRIEGWCQVLAGFWFVCLEMTESGCPHRLHESGHTRPQSARPRGQWQQASGKKVYRWDYIDVPYKPVHTLQTSVIHLLYVH